MAKMIMIHDLIDPNDPQGRSYKEINAEKTHGIPLGSLVELESGARLFVAKQGRDCDLTPLYWLTARPDEIGEESGPFMSRGWVGGYSESSLKVIRKP